jgi:hypothetical protein
MVSGKYHPANAFCPLSASGARPAARRVEKDAINRMTGIRIERPALRL